VRTHERQPRGAVLRLVDRADAEAEQQAERLTNSVKLM
jgi:hypothetical protein